MLNIDAYVMPSSMLLAMKANNIKATEAASLIDTNRNAKLLKEGKLKTML